LSQPGETQKPEREPSVATNFAETLSREAGEEAEEQ